MAPFEPVSVYVDEGTCREEEEKNEEGAVEVEIHIKMIDEEKVRKSDEYYQVSKTSREQKYICLYARWSVRTFVLLEGFALE